MTKWSRRAATQGKKSDLCGPVRQNGEAGRSRTLQRFVEAGRSRTLQRFVEAGRSRTLQRFVEAGRSRTLQHFVKAGRSRTGQLLTGKLLTRPAAVLWKAHGGSRTEKSRVMEKYSGQILIFGGTTEGRSTAERLLALGIRCTVCVATEYGAEVMRPHPQMTLRTGRMDREAMAELMRNGAFICVIDATHPHAAAVSEEILAACRRTGMPCLRLRRDLSGECIPADGAAERSENPDPAGSVAELSEKPDPAGGASEFSEKPDPAGSASDFTGKRIFVSSAEEAGAFLSTVPGNVLVTTGSKELGRFAQALGDPARIFARVLPSPESLAACAGAGLAGKQIFAMQGPFDTEMNCALLRHSGAFWMLTKETGAAGGYPAKLEAAARCGTGVVVIRAPKRQPGAETDTASAGDGFAHLTMDRIEQIVEEALRRVREAGDVRQDRRAVDGSVEASAEASADASEALRRVREAGDVRQDRGAVHGFVEASAGASADAAEALRRAREAGDVRQGVERDLSLIGIGVGAPGARTQQAREALAAAQVLFGARSVLQNLQNDKEAEGKEVVPLYESEAILRYLAEHPQIRRAAVAYSGDSGFYSGASSMLECLRRKGDSPVFSGIRVHVICGISSVSWFSARAGIPWQDWKILSSHGRFCNVTGQVRRNPKCFLLLSGAEDLRRTGAALEDAQSRGVLGKLSLIYGYELSRPGEEIRACTAQELTGICREGLYVLYIEHEGAAKRPVLPGLSDSAFTRGKAPMTSSEIRALSLCRLGLNSQAVLWDIGAGTGSVSVEAALSCPEGRVWSVEYREDALALLFENRAKFCLQNMEIIEGRAPEALAGLPAPTHVFIGGSGGEIGEILRTVFVRNPRARVVVNCITAETMAALQTALGELSVCDLQWVQVSVQRGEKLGRYHYLRALNPVFIISFQGTQKESGEALFP